MSGYRVEWECCGDETYTQAWEPEECPFCELNRLHLEVEQARAEAQKWHGRVATLEMIGSSLLHGHKMSEVDWKAFKALEEYFRIHIPEAGGGE